MIMFGPGFARGTGVFLLDQPAIVMREFVGPIRAGFDQPAPAHLL